MRKDMIYHLRILILETYVRITMIGYKSKQNKVAQKFGGEGSLSGHLMGGKHE